MSNTALPELRLTTDQAIHWCELSVAALQRARPALDQANVFPIADADTGTNMFLTMTHATAPQETATHSSTTQNADDLLDSVAHRAILSARGNSGAILAHYLTGFARGHREGGIATALTYGAQQARHAVMNPVEGTILTAADAAAQAMDTVRGGEPIDALRAVRQAAYRAYENSAHDLPALASQAVRDAGACGFYLIISALIDVLTPGIPVPGEDSTVLPESTLRTGQSLTHTAVNHDAEHTQHPYSMSDTEYEVTALMQWHTPPEAATITALRHALTDNGDSLVLAISPSTPSLGPLHIHTNNPADIIALCQHAADTISHIAVRNLHNPQLATTAPVVLSRSPHLVRDMARSAATVIMAGTHPITTEELSVLLPDTPHQRIIANVRSIADNLSETYPHIQLHANDLELATNLTYLEYGETEPNNEHSTHHTYSSPYPPSATQLTAHIARLPAHTTALLLHDTHFPEQHQQTIHATLTSHGITITVIPSGTPGDTADLTLTWNT